MKTLNRKILAEAMDARLKDDLDSGRILGANLFVSQESDVLLKKNYGFRDTEKEKPMTFDTVFRLASMTKPITTVAVLREMEKGNLDLFDAVETFLPEYRNRKIARLVDGKVEILKDAVNKPTILHLLTHSSGIGTGPLGDYQAKMMPKEYNESLEKCVTYYANQPISFEPYLSSVYSPTAGFDILARIVELVSGKSFEDYIQKEICRPLGMTDTTFMPGEKQKEKMCEMHTFENGKIGKRKMPEGCIFEDIPVTHFCGGAGLVSTLEDYIKFATMLQKGGENILKESTVKSLSLPHIPTSSLGGATRTWSLGMRTIFREEYRILPIGTFGWSGAYGTHFFVDPVNKVTAIYMKNSAYDGGAAAVTAHHFEEDIFHSYE